MQQGYCIVNRDSVQRQPQFTLVLEPPHLLRGRRKRQRPAQKPSYPCLHQSVIIKLMSTAAARHQFQTDDSRLRPIADKVLSGERLSFDDGVALYRSGDILAIGWLANYVREKL